MIGAQVSGFQLIHCHQLRVCQLLFGLVKKSITRAGYGNSLNRPCFWDASSPLFNRTQAQHIIKTGFQQRWCLEARHSKHATDQAPWCKQLPSYLTQRMCFDTCFLDTYLHHSPRQCHNTYLPTSSHTWGKRSFPTATKLFHIHLDCLHSPTLLVQLCHNLTTVRLLAVISFLCSPPSWLYFSVVSCTF